MVKYDRLNREFKKAPIVVRSEKSKNFPSANIMIDGKMYQIKSYQTKGNPVDKKGRPIVGWITVTLLPPLQREFTGNSNGAFKPYTPQVYGGGRSGGNW